MFMQSHQGARKPVAEQKFAVAPGSSLLISWSFSLPAAPENRSVALADDFYPRCQDEADIADVLKEKLTWCKC